MSGSGGDGKGFDCCTIAAVWEEPMGDPEVLLLNRPTNAHQGAVGREPRAELLGAAQRRFLPDPRSSAEGCCARFDASRNRATFVELGVGADHAASNSNAPNRTRKAGSICFVLISHLVGNPFLMNLTLVQLYAQQPKKSNNDIWRFVGLGQSRASTPGVVAQPRWASIWRQRGCLPPSFV